MYDLPTPDAEDHLADVLTAWNDLANTLMAMPKGIKRDTQPAILARVTAFRSLVEDAPLV